MTIKVMADNNIDIPSKMDAINYNISQGYAPHVISRTYGYNGGKQGLEVKAVGLKAPIYRGAATAYGYTVVVDENDMVSDVPTNSTGYICLTIDLSQPSGKEGRVEFVTALKQENLLINGTIYNIPLAKITTDSSTITTLEDVRFKELTSKGGLYFESQQDGKVDIKNTATNDIVGCNYERVDEYFTGRYNYNGKKIYEQIFTFNGALFKANQWNTSPALPANVDATSVTMIGSTYRTGNVVYQIPYHESDDYKVDMYFSRLDRKVYVRAGNKNSAGACIVRIQYCKG